MFSRNGFRPGRDALLIAAGYAVVAAAYILVSGRWALSAAGSIEELHWFEQWKGLGFVAVSAGGLFLFAKIVFRSYARVVQADTRAQADSASERQRLESGLLAAGICHDANNVLTALRLGLDFLSKDIPAGGNGRPMLREIEGQVQRLELMNQRLLEASRDTMNAKLQPLHLAEEIRNFLEHTRHASAYDGAQVTVENLGGLTVLSEPLLLHQILENLVLNAVQSEEGRSRRVLVRGVRDGAKVTLEVHDDGPGIPEDLQRHVFQPFFTTKDTGTGLGLVSVRACVRAHNGNVDVGKSPILGGACMKVQLPAAPEAEQSVPGAVTR